MPPPAIVEAATSAGTDEYLIFLSGSSSAHLVSHNGKATRDARDADQRYVFNALQSLTADGRLLFATRFVRLFAYGALSVVLVLYLVALGLTESDTGLLLTAILLGDTLVSLYLTTQADRIGRRRMLVIGALLMAGAGLAFALTRQMWLLVVAGT